jgi:hypothetical protein
MKSFAKLLLVGAVAVMAVAISVAPSEAAKKKKAKGPAPGTYVGELCSTACNKSNVCNVMIWAADSKWYQAAFTPVCFQPGCPAACK